MRISKFIHSCLLIEDQGKSILIDPGIYSTSTLKLETIQNLDYLLITHEHADHMDTQFIKTLVQKFPNVKVLSNSGVKDILGKEGIVVETIGDKVIQITETKHEKVFGIALMAQNCSFTIFNRLTHPGDSFSFSQTSEILALPLQAPWGDLTEAVTLAEKLKPKVIIPIHDWHLRDEARTGFYKRLEEHFLKKNITFLGIEKGTVEV